MTSPTARANAASDMEGRREASARLSELVLRDIEEAAKAEGLYTGDVLTVLANVAAHCIRTHCGARNDDPMKLLDSLTETIEAILEKGR